MQRVRACQDVSGSGSLNVGRTIRIGAGIVAVPVVAEGALLVRALLHPDAPSGSEASAGYPTGSHAHGMAAQLVDGLKVVTSNAADHIRARAGEGVVPPGRRLAPQVDADAAWRALSNACEVRGAPGLFAGAPGGALHASVWATSQVLDAAIDRASRTGNWSDVNHIASRAAALYGDGAWSDGVEHLPNGSKFASHPFYDDNAWVALDLLQAYRASGKASYLQRVEAMVPFFERGVLADGTVLWGRDGASARETNTCAAGPVGQVFAQLHEATGKLRYRELAASIEARLVQRLRGPDGLYADNERLDTGVVEGMHLSYNQGTPIGLEVELYRITHDTRYLERATATARSAVAWLSRNDTLWKQAPAFNAIFFRNLLALDEVAPAPAYRRLLDAYLQRALQQGIDPATGLYTQGDISRYGRAGNVLDQSGFVQMFELAGGADPSR